MKDPSGAVFIDRDPVLFNVILSYLRTRQLPSFPETSLESLRHEAEFYGISPLIRKLDAVHEVLNKGACGDVMFQGLLRSDHSPDPLESSKGDTVVQIVAHHNFIAVARPHYVTCYRLKDTLGWQKIFETDRLSRGVTGIAFCYSCGSSPNAAAVVPGGAHNHQHHLPSSPHLMLGIAQDRDPCIRLCSVKLSGPGQRAEVVKDIGRFQLKSDSIDALFFIGPRMVALGFNQSRVGVWHQGSPPWLEQSLSSSNGSQVITAYDKVDCVKFCNYLLLGSRIGALFLVDMHKFPLRLKDGDLLINQVYEDPDGEEITAISCYLTRPDQGSRRENSLEIAYGTKGGTVRVLVQHPETVGHGPQLFQTFKVHLSPISSVMLSEKFLISTCSKNHIRSWSLTRFRGLISTQPGSTPHASFSLLKLPADEYSVVPQSPQSSPEHSPIGVMSFLRRTLPVRRPYNGPHGDQEDGDKQVFIERVHPFTSQVNVVVASNGNRICTLKSVDSSPTTTFCVHECEAVAMGSRSRRYILTGHVNGHVQVWDLTTAFERLSSQQNVTKVTPQDILTQLL